MLRRLSLAAAPLAVACTLLVAACGSSSSSSSSGGSSSSASSSALTNSGGSFCDQTRSFVAQLGQLSKSLTSTTPGATPNVSAFKQLYGAVTSAIDQLDSSAPGEIASALHTMRGAYDAANGKVQSANTLQEMSTGLQSIDTAAVKTAGTQVQDYLKNTCGINPSATP